MKNYANNVAYDDVVIELSIYRNLARFMVTVGVDFVCDKEIESK